MSTFNRMKGKETRGDKDTSCPFMQIGKSGVTESLIGEIKLQIKRQKILRIRILKSARTMDRDEIAQEVVERTGLRLVDIRGNTFILARK